MVIEQDPQLTMLLLVFREQAQRGNLLLQYESLLLLLTDSLLLSLSEARELLLKAEHKGYLITTVRQFGRAKTLTLVSMRLGFLSVESILWVLRSLHLDEMAPNERAVQSRVKEAFGIKIHQCLWELVLEFVFKDPHSNLSPLNEDKTMSLDLKAINQSFSSAYAAYSINTNAAS